MEIRLSAISGQRSAKDKNEILAHKDAERILGDDYYLLML
jgi:hypothetical protein